MKRVIYLTVALYWGLGWAQSERLVSLQRKVAAIQEWVGRWTSPPQARTTQDVWVLDTLQRDSISQAGTCNWTIGEYHTYTYWPSGLQRSDSGFIKGMTPNWYPYQVTHTWWYSRFPAESIQVYYEVDANYQLQRSDSTAWRFTLAGSQVRAEIWHYEWNAGAWSAYERDSVWVRLIGNISLVDSIKIFYPSGGGGGWTSYERIDFTYDAQNRLTLQHYVSTENPDTTQHLVQKYFYETTAPGRLLRDSLEFYRMDRVGPGAPNKINSLRMERRYRYVGTDPKIRADSAQAEVFWGSWFVVSGEKNEYTYDPSQADSLTQRIVFRSIFAGPWECSDRYLYFRHRVTAPTSLARGREGFFLPMPLSAGEAIHLPLSAGEGWTLYTVTGQVVARGEATAHGATLITPTQGGLYLLQVRGQAYKLLILP